MFCRYFAFSALSLATLTGCSEAGLSDDISIVSSRNISSDNSVVPDKKNETSRDEKIRSNYLSLKKTWEGFVLRTGWLDAASRDFDVSTLSKEEKEQIIKDGLLAIENSVNLDEYKKTSPYILANYFDEQKNFKKSMYWALKGAENGSPDCMVFLSNAYRSGEGVVQDLAEGIKWTFLGSALGDDWCKKWVKDFGVSGLTNQQLAPLLIEGQKRANEWMKQHSELFFSAE